MTIISAPSESITLYYKAGSSDKIYQASIEPSGTGYIVTFAYGRRGSTLQTGIKTTEPVDYATAKKLFEKLVKDKTAKGYTPGVEGTPYQSTENQDRTTGILPQLLNPIEETQAQWLLTDSDWYAQEKYDGQRVLIRKVGETITAINRRGLVIALPLPILEAALIYGGGQWLLDGEALGDRFVAFDLLENACVDLRQETYQQRLQTLGRLDCMGNGRRDGTIRMVETATSSTAKRALLVHLRKINAEGIVLKRRLAPYTPGRPATGGDQRKLKFTATASCLVEGHHGDRRSVTLALLKDGKFVGVGSVTIPAKQPIPPAGAVVEIRYLYAFFGGSLYQPVFLGVRSDLAPQDCVISQLKYKAEGSEESE